MAFKTTSQFKIAGFENLPPGIPPDWEARGIFPTWERPPVPISDVERGIFKADYYASKEPWDWAAWDRQELYVGKGSKVRQSLRALPRPRLSRLGKGLAVAGLASLGYWAYNRFSGKDDAYNTIEGMPELGLASQQRKILTDFGSGYRGLLFAVGLIDDVAMVLARNGQLDDLHRYIQQVKIPEENDGYQTIDGLHPGNKGMATHIIRYGTPFGSKHDIVKHFAQMAGKSLEEFIGMPAFQKVLAESEVVGKIGQGGFGEVFHRRGVWEGQVFNLVEKRAKQTGTAFDDLFRQALGEESVTLQALGETQAAPHFYGYTEGAGHQSLFMEHIPGKTVMQEFQGTPLSISKEGERMLSETIGKAASLGIKHADIAARNIMYHPITGEAFLIDWGRTTRVDPREALNTAEQSMREIMGAEAFASVSVPAGRPLKPVKDVVDAFATTELPLGARHFRNIEGFPVTLLDIPPVQHIDGLAPGGMAHLLRSPPFRTPAGSLTRAFGSLFGKKAWEGVFIGTSEQVAAWTEKEGLALASGQLREGAAVIAKKAAGLSHGVSGIDIRLAASGELRPSLSVNPEEIFATAKRTLGRELTPVEQELELQRFAIHEKRELGQAMPYAKKLLARQPGITPEEFRVAMKERIASRGFASHFSGAVPLGELEDVAAVGPKLYAHTKSMWKGEIAGIQKNIHYAQKNIEKYGKVLPYLQREEKVLGRMLETFERRRLPAIMEERRAARRLAASAEDLRGSQQRLSQAAVSGGKGHLHPAGKHVKQGSRYGGGL